MKKKLLIVAKSLGGGGSEVALIELINHLNVEKFNVTLLLMDKDDEYKYRLKNKINIKYMEFDNPFYKSLVSMYTFIGKGVKKAHVNKYLKIYNFCARHSKKLKQHFDIAVDFYGYGSFTTAYVALNVSADKKAFWVHDEEMSWIGNSERYFKKYDEIFGVSKAVKSKLDKLYPKDTYKHKTMYNFVDFKKIIHDASMFLPPEFNKEEFNIVTVGRISKEKGYDIAIKAANQLKKQGINFTWYVIGEGKDKNKLRKKVLRFDLKDNFIFLGRKDNPCPYMKYADLYVQPSRHEGFGLTVLEARILKKIIVASNINAFKEQIKNGKNGLLTTLSSDDLASSILKIKEDKELCRLLIQNIKNEEIDIMQNNKAFERFCGE